MEGLTDPPLPPHSPAVAGRSEGGHAPIAASQGRIHDRVQINDVLGSLVLGLPCQNSSLMRSCKVRHLAVHEPILKERKILLV